VSPYTYLGELARPDAPEEGGRSLWLCVQCGGAVGDRDAHAGACRDGDPAEAPAADAALPVVPWPPNPPGLVRRLHPVCGDRPGHDLDR
jgi:hypothetical protein